MSWPEAIYIVMQLKKKKKPTGVSGIFKCFRYPDVTNYYYSSTAIDLESFNPRPTKITLSNVSTNTGAGFLFRIGTSDTIPDSGAPENIIVNAQKPAEKSYAIPPIGRYLILNACGKSGVKEQTSRAQLYHYLIN